MRLFVLRCDVGFCGLVVSHWSSESSKHFSESQLISYVADNQLDEMWGKVELNHRPAGYESAALTPELLPPRRGNDSGWGMQEAREKVVRLLAKEL